MTFKPMLSGKAELDKLKFPLLASPKIDGIRCLIRDGVAVSRTLKPIPNAHVQRLLSAPELEGLDGEIIVGSPTDPDVYVKTNSGVMSRDGEPDFTFLTFDRWDLGDAGFEMRWLAATAVIGFPYVQRLQHQKVESREQLHAVLEQHLREGYEGTMLRSPTGPYKHGRSTVKEGWLLKCKTFEDSEAQVISCVEEMHNANEATIDELGHTKRSSHQANKVGKGTLGALVVQDVASGVIFQIGSGFTAEERRALWQDKPIGRLITYRHMPHGAKDAPRHPVWKGFRDPIDVISE